MAESHKFKTLDDLTAVFPEVPWKASSDTTWVFDEKADEYVKVTKGQYVVKIADRFEVHDEEPTKAHPAEAPKAEKKAVPEARKANEAPSADAPNAHHAEGIKGPVTQTNENTE